MPIPCSEIVNDIEDLIETAGVTDKERYSSRSTKQVKVRAVARKKADKECIANGNEGGDAPLKSIVPGTQSIYIKTWGCAHNNSDSEYMAGQLAAYGYRLTDVAEDADLWLLNSCTVKGPAEDHFRNEVERGLRLSKHIVTAGCVPQGAPRTSYLSGLSAIGVQNIDRVVEVVEETLKGHSVRLFGQKKSGGKKAGGANLELPKVRKNPFVEIIAISTGCLNQCTYCKTKHARGELGSYPLQDIVARAETAFAEGVKEIWLTSEDTGAYGRDIGHTLPGLLTALTAVIPEGCMLRLGMTNPPYILEHLDKMAAVLNHPRVYKFLHVPVQSGSDQVLSDMKREYSVAEFMHVVTFLRQRVPGITIATDIICAFPTETEEDFTATMALCEQLRFPSLFINQFYPRPGTPAARLPRVPAQEAKRRTRALTHLFQSYTSYEDQLGQTMHILITEESPDGTKYIGHNQFYHQVVLSKALTSEAAGGNLPDQVTSKAAGEKVPDQVTSEAAGEKGSLLGQTVLVKITEAKKHCLLATAVEPNCASDTDSAYFTPTVICLVFALLFKIILVFLSGHFLSHT